MGNTSADGNTSRHAHFLCKKCGKIYDLPLDASLAMAAGNDLIMPGSGHCRKEILEGVISGKIQQTDARRCCANVIKAVLDSAIQREYIG